MRCKGLLMAVLSAFLVGVPGFAQRDSLTVNPFLDNWSLQGTAGLHALVRPGGEFRGRITPGFDVVAGKAFSPYGGARLGLQGGSYAMWGAAPRFRVLSEEGTFRGRTLYKESLGILYLHGDVYWDVTSTLLGVDPSRALTLAPYMHFGFAVSYGSGHVLEREYASGAGLLALWRLSEHWSATLDTRATVFTPAFSPDRASRRLIGLSLQGGMTWHPGRTGWDAYAPGRALHNDFWGNWFLSAQGGVNTIGTFRNFRGAWAPALDVTAGKWFSPSFGMRAGWQGYQWAGRGTSPRPGVVTQPDGPLLVERLGFDYLHGDVLWNWIPYAPQRRWRLGPYVHMGFMREKGLENGLRLGRFFAGGAGFLAQFRLLPRTWLQADVRAFLLNSGTAGDTRGGRVFAASAMAGLAVDLGKPDWDRWRPLPEAPRERVRTPGQPYSLGRFADNWSLRTLIGATGTSGAADVSLSKWFTPEIGLRAGYQGVSLSDARATTGYAYLHQDLQVSLVDLFFGYRPERGYRLVPYMHFGVIAEYDPVRVPFTGRGFEYAAGAGFSASVQLSRRLSLTAELRETLLTSSASPSPHTGMSAVSTFLGGVEYAFGTRGWKRLSETPDGGVRMGRFWDNWFAGGALGVNGFTGMERFSSRAALAGEIVLGKWFSPQFGVRGGLSGLRLSRTGYEPRTGVYALELGEGLFREDLGFAYLHGDFLWNLTETVLPYREDRFWSLIPYMHMGALAEFGISSAHKGLFERELAEGFGLLNSLRIDSRIDFTLDVRAMVVRGEASGDQASRAGIIPTALLGISARLGGSGFDTAPVRQAAPEVRERARWAASLNLLDAALLGTAGVSVQYGISRHWSVESVVRYNGWSFREGALYDRRQAFSIGTRWWPWHLYSGFFVKGSAQLEALRRRGMPLFADVAGERYGAGLSAGYSLMLTRRLNLDLGAGAWGGRMRNPATGERTWFVAPDGFTAGVMLVF